MQDAFLATLIARFGDRGLRRGTPPDPVAVFPARHSEVGDVRIWAPALHKSSVGDLLVARIEVGDILGDSFDNFDAHLPVDERIRRVTNDIVRFLEELFADRLLFWKSMDGAGKGGWRERGEAGHLDPLVIDDRTYGRYVWSGPLGAWRTTSRVLARGRIVDDREYDIVQTRLQHAGAVGFNEPLTDDERQRAARLVAEYEREHDL